MSGEPRARKAGLDQASVAGERVLVRVDFNVPLTDQGEIRDDRRIRESLPTIRELVQRGAQVILITHVGRPKGRPDPKLSTRAMGQRLEELLHQPVAWLPDCLGAPVEERVRQGHPGEVLMLENLRFHPGEEANDPEFARRLATLADLYVDDAFGTAHRAHASTTGIAQFLPAYAGRLMELELAHLGALLDHPDHPLLAVIGGSKLSTKLAVLDNLIPCLDTLCLGGAMCSTFLKAEGLEVGRSLVEDDFLGRATQVIALARSHQTALELPLDVVVAPGPDAPAEQVETKSVKELDELDMILDVGPQTIDRWAGLVARAATLVWNGPLGLYENPRFAEGTRSLATAVASSSARSVTGGGDLQAAIQELGLEASFTHVSTGGGATLEFLEGAELPGVEVLLDARPAPAGSSQP